MNGIGHLTRAVFLTTLMTAPVTAVFAAEMPGHWKRAELSVGAYLVTFGSDLRVDSNDLGIGTDLNLEDELDLEDELVAFRVDGYSRFFNRHRLQLGYYDLSRDGERTLDQQIEFGDEVFDVGVTVESDFDFRVAKLGYVYSILQNDQWDAGLSLGITAIQFRADRRHSVCRQSEHQCGQRDQGDHSTASRPRWAYLVCVRRQVDCTAKRGSLPARYRKI